MRNGTSRQLGESARLGFSELYAGHVSFVRGALSGMGSPEEEREDLVSEVFVRVLHTLHRLDWNRPVRPWLRSIAKRVLVDFFRRRRDVYDALDGSIVARPDDLLEANEEREMVRIAMAAIAPDRRGVFESHEIQGIAIPEIARLLDLPLNTAYSRLRLARAEFYDALRLLVWPASTPSGTADPEGEPSWPSRT
jgi:RNA polymerase sigma-70 factor, ECF subfamily